MAKAPKEEDLDHKRVSQQSISHSYEEFAAGKIMKSPDEVRAALESEEWKKHGPIVDVIIAVSHRIAEQNLILAELLKTLGSRERPIIDAIASLAHRLDEQNKYLRDLLQLMTAEPGPASPPAESRPPR